MVTPLEGAGIERGLLGAYPPLVYLFTFCFEIISNLQQSCKNIKTLVVPPA